MDMWMFCDGTTNPQDILISNSWMSSFETEDNEDVMLECDYDRSPTKLYRSVEDKRWEDVSYFLETGLWNNILCMAGEVMLGGDEPNPPRVEARTWVTALYANGQVRWCKLPLHAAITFQAPLSIIQKLVEVYPESAHCADDQGLLPLHYAFRYGAPEDVIGCLVQAFPQGIRKRTAKNRLPLDFAAFSSKPERGFIIQRFIDLALKEATGRRDDEATQEVTATMSTSAPPSRATFGSRATEDEPEVNCILGPYYYRKREDETGDDRDDDDVHDRFENVPRAIQAPLQKRQQPKERSISHRVKKNAFSSYHYSSPSSDDRSRRSATDDRSQRSRRSATDDRSQRSRRSVTDDRSQRSRRSVRDDRSQRSRRSTADDRSRRSGRSVRSMSVKDGSNHHGRSRSRSVSRKPSSSSSSSQYHKPPVAKLVIHKPPVAKRVIRNIFQGFQGRV